MKKYNTIINVLIVIITIVFVFTFFETISKMTPLAGDDWGYAVQGMSGNPFASAWKFYFTWSGRFFSELWGFVVAPRKWLWDILNPALFAGITLLIIKLTYTKKNLIIQIALILTIIFSVDNTLRIETYSWIMGTTYVVPLFLTLLYFVLIKPVLLEDKKMNLFRLIGSVCINLVVGLCMENVAVVLVLGNILILTYCWFNKKEYVKQFLAILVISCISLAILRFSPGATFRLARDNQAWVQMNLFEQVSFNWVLFLQRTFINNKYMMMVLSFVMMLALLSNTIKNHKVSKQTIIMFVMNAVCFVISFAPILYGKTNVTLFLMFYDVEYSMSALLFCSIFYIAYAGTLLWQVWSCLEETQRFEGVFYVTLAGSANLVMMLSPIFGARSSIYTVFLIIVFVSFMASNIYIDKYAQVVIIILLAIFVRQKNNALIYQYEAVEANQIERDQIIKYYQLNQDEKEAWIPKMPKGFIHSADIEAGDDYHMEVFKQYYGLNPNIKLVFYEK